MLRSTIALLALLGPLLVPAAATSVPEPLELRVMSFNIRYGLARDGANAWAKRRRLVLETIRAAEPDALGLQEALPFQVDWLSERLPGYGLLAAGRDDGERRGETCALLWRRERFRQEAGGHLWLSETPSVPGSRSWDAALPRMASWVRLRARAQPSATLCLLNTHFDHIGREARRRSAALLRERLPRLALGRPAVVLGDFNAAPGSAPHAELTGKGGLVDAFRVAPPRPAGPEGTFHGFRGGPGTARIDWVLVERDVEVLAAAIDRTSRDGRFPSDHYPVVVDLRLPALRWH